MLNDEIEKKNNDPKNDSGQIGLTCQTCDLGHETKITPLKKININYEV